MSQKKIRKTAMVRARTTPSLKKAAEKVLGTLGITPSQAINMFYKQIALKEGIPFDITAEDLMKGDKPEHYIAVKDDDHLRSLLGLQ